MNSDSRSTAASSAVPPPLPDAANQGDATGGIIPYKNPHALAAYYLGVFSLIPGLGILLGCIAVPLAISGLKKKKANPVISGTVHAWVGIILGGGSTILQLVVLATIAWKLRVR